MWGGMVRYRFRADDDDVNVVIEGEGSWVKQQVEALGLMDVGWTMPLAIDVKPVNLSSVSKARASKRSKSTSSPAGSDVPLGAKPKDMGPTPDPSRIPVVRRPIGELNLEEEINKVGIKPAERPDLIELMEMLDDVDPPQPVQGAMSVDPMAEAWLRVLMQFVVRDFGMTALRTEDIEEVASERLGGRTDVKLEVWLDSLFSAGKLVKVHGGDAVGWGPSPRWLNGK